MNRKTICTLGSLLLATTLMGCGGTSAPSAKQTMQQQNTEKLDQAAKVMQQVQTPSFNNSLERENIRDRLVQTNDPNMLQWIYPMSAGRVIGRFPVRGKVTSGGKRLTSTEMFVRGDGGEYNQDFVMEAPDEMGAYGNSGDYIFWFDPAGRYHQHKGDYFLSPVPYKIDLGYGTISTDLDEKENAKVADYKKQIKETKK